MGIVKLIYCVLILKCLFRFAEIDTVLSKVLTCFSVIPFKFH